ncbi:hypothetical protein B0I37DRAFT_102161 [Chaetomium sp. MPI-CAGE-AT-0009]|nr:hypothetical protein B0I37DRAFT_102161 [Chaetomium sp. MPI-CAGE-AT-0009]
MSRLRCVPPRRRSQQLCNPDINMVRTRGTLEGTVPRVGLRSKGWRVQQGEEMFEPSLSAPPFPQGHNSNQITHHAGKADSPQLLWALRNGPTRFPFIDHRHSYLKPVSLLGGSCKAGAQNRFQCSTASLSRNPTCPIRNRPNFYNGNPFRPGPCSPPPPPVRHHQHCISKRANSKHTTQTPLHHDYDASWRYPPSRQPA